MYENITQKAFLRWVLRETLQSSDAITAAVLCGSVLRGDFSVRSDLDCVVVYNPMRRREAFSVMQELNKLSKKLYVPLEFIPLDAEIAQTSMHHIISPFASHMHMSIQSGGCIKGDPLSVLTFAGIDTKESIKTYLRNKLRRIEKGISELPVLDDDELCGFLQTILEAPLHIARNLIALRNIEMAEDTKREVLRHYLAFAGNREARLIEKVVRADRAYTEELHRQLVKADEQEYREALDRLQELAWDALEFVRISAFSVIANYR